MSKSIKRACNRLTILSVCVLALARPLVATASSSEGAFQNQLISLGETTTAVIQHALQMGYDYINGQPWSPDRAIKGTEAGLGVLFNTGADSAKWMRINSAMTTINGRRITAADRANFDKAFCMKSPNAIVLTERFMRDMQYPGETILFHPNYFSREAIDILVDYNIELFESHGGTATHAGVYVDRVNAGAYSPYPGPCLNPGRKDFDTAADGQLEYIKRLQHYFGDQLGLPMSGNPYRIQQYQSRHLVAPFDFYYHENGSFGCCLPTWCKWCVAPFDLYYNANGSPSDYQVLDISSIPPERVAVSFDQFNNDYLQALRTAGIAIQQGSWFGWFARAKPSQTVNSVQLLRALPNWDNLVDAASRSWNPNTLVYQTSNSHADPHVAYGRHPRTGKLFVVFQSLQGALQLRPGEVVTEVKRVNNLFIETTDGRDDLAIAGARVSLKRASNLGKGYVVTVH